MPMTRILLSHFVHASDVFEHEMAGDQAELVVRTRAEARTGALPQAMGNRAHCVNPEHLRTTT